MIYFKHIYKYFDAIFFGHTHRLECINIQDLDGELFASIAKSLKGDNSMDVRYQNGYNVVDLYPKEKLVHYCQKNISKPSQFI